MSFSANEKKARTSSWELINSSGSMSNIREFSIPIVPILNADASIINKADVTYAQAEIDTDTHTDQLKDQESFSSDSKGRRSTVAIPYQFPDESFFTCKVLDETELEANDDGEEGMEIERVSEYYLNSPATRQLREKLDMDPELPPSKYPRDPQGKYYNQKPGFDGRSDREHIEHMAKIETMQRMALNKNNINEKNINAEKRQDLKAVDKKNKTPWRRIATSSRDIPCVLAIIALMFTTIVVAVYFGAGLNQNPLQNSSDNDPDSDPSLGGAIPTMSPTLTPVISDPPFVATDSPLVPTSYPSPLLNNTNAPSISVVITSPPTRKPTKSPSIQPTSTSSSIIPTVLPTSFPTVTAPTNFPTTSPSPFPTFLPGNSPTFSPIIVEALCSQTTGAASTSVCLTDLTYATCAATGTVLQYTLDCDRGAICSCQKMVRILGSNPCQSTGTNQCQVDAIP